ncbi:unnamed protein product [Pleuronectes platessa]|uniref:Uncharacterized protein n=1 Tax=Pleuronectes platessa TaxID=8262 RepID=A0A9N7UCF4_PLEPL|nr:unnamed protein product [Pleuronectes platessa]
MFVLELGPHSEDELQEVKKDGCGFQTAPGYVFFPGLVAVLLHTAAPCRSVEQKVEAWLVQRSLQRLELCERSAGLMEGGAASQAGLSQSEQGGRARASAAEGSPVKKLLVTSVFKERDDLKPPHSRCTAGAPLSFHRLPALSDMRTEKLDLVCVLVTEDVDTSGNSGSDEKLRDKEPLQESRNRQGRTKSSVDQCWMKSSKGLDESGVLSNPSCGAELWNDTDDLERHSVLGFLRQGPTVPLRNHMHSDVGGQIFLLKGAETPLAAPGLEMRVNVKGLQVSTGEMMVLYPQSD